MAYSNRLHVLVLRLGTSLASYTVLLPLASCLLVASSPFFHIVSRAIFFLWVYHCFSPSLFSSLPLANSLRSHTVTTVVVRVQRPSAKKKIMVGHLTTVFVFCLSLGLIVSYKHGREGRYRNQILGLRQVDTVLGGTTSVIDTFERSLSAKNIGTGTKHNQFEWSCGLVRGLHSTLPFRRGDTVVQLPVVEAIAAPDAVGKSGRCPAGMDDVWIASSVTVRVALQLLKEWKDDSASPFAAYIGALPLPGEFGTPLHWPQSVLDQFPYSYLSHSVDNQKNRLKELYETRIAKSKVFQGISYERFVWAVEVVGSRAFKGIGIASSSFPLYGGISAVLVSVSAFLSTRNGIPDFLPLMLAVMGMFAPLPAVIQATESNCVLLPAIDSCNHRGVGAICDIALDPSKGRIVWIRRSLNACSTVYKCNMYLSCMFPLPHSLGVSSVL